jgi:hypothetical protein
MIEAVCLCGAVRIEAPSAPEAVTSCNCEACRRMGALWAYYPASQVRISGETRGYARRDIPDQAEPMLTLHHCVACGCITHWASLTGEDRMGVNVRLMPVEVLAAARVRRLDGARTWAYVEDPDWSVTFT